MRKTVEDLKNVREKLVEQRRRDVYSIVGPHSNEAIEKAAQIHTAIAAIDAAIAEGKDHAPIRSVYDRIADNEPS